MKEKSLLVIDGFDSNYHPACKIIAIEDESSIFRGVVLDAHQCDLSDGNTIIAYLGKHLKDLNAFSLIAGISTPTLIRYSNYVSGHKLTFGTFEASEYDFYGREKKIDDGGKMRRDLDQTVRHYQKPVVKEGCDDLYDLIEYILLSQQKNGTWLGIQASVKETYCMQSMSALEVLPTPVFKK